MKPITRIILSIILIVITVGGIWFYYNEIHPNSQEIEYPLPEGEKPQIN